MAADVSPVPEGHHTVTPYLLVEDAHGLLEFVQQAFGATVLDASLTPDGNVQHAEFRIGDSIVMLGGANDQWSPMPCMLHLYVEDVDTVYRKALEAGAESIRVPEDMFYGDRSGGVRDPFGNQWWIATHVEDVSPEEMARRQEEAGGGKAGE
jgi:PhnB protein